MNKFIILIIAFLISLSIGCGNSRGKIKANPDSENYIKCPVCKGYGKIQVQTVVKDKKKPDIDEDSGCYNALAGTSCLFALGWEIAHRDDMEYKNRETDREIRNTENSVYDDHSTASARSSTKKTIKCHRCNGAGWISRFEYTITPMNNQNELDEIIKANEELNKKN